MHSRDYTDPLYGKLFGMRYIIRNIHNWVNMLCSHLECFVICIQLDNDKYISFNLHLNNYLKLKIQFANVERLVLHTEYSDIRIFIELVTEKSLHLVTRAFYALFLMWLS